MVLIPRQNSDKTLSGILSRLKDLFTSKFTKTCMTSSTVNDRVERRVSRISEMVGDSAFSSIFREKTELKNELKIVAYLLNILYCSFNGGLVLQTVS